MLKSMMSQMALGGGGRRSGVPKEGLIFYAKTVDGELVDTIGLSISELYPQLDPLLHPLVSADGGVTRLSDAQIITNIEASQYLNAGLGLTGNATKGYALYADGTAETVLAKAYQYFGETYSPYVERRLILEIYTNRAGTTGSTSIGLPLAGSFTIDWGDGNVQQISNAVTTTLTTHNYGMAGTFTISIGVGLTSIKFANIGDKRKVNRVLNLGSTGLNTLQVAFYGCSEMVEFTLGDNDTSLVSSLNGCFALCSKLQVVDLRGMNTSNVTYFNDLYYSCTLLDYVYMSGLDVSKVTTVNAMFHTCTTLSDIDIAGWEINSLEDLSGMLGNCSISSVSYSKMLITFANSVYSNNGPYNRPFISLPSSAQYNSTVYGGTPFNNAVAARAYLVTATGSGGAGWTITGDSAL